MAIVTDDINTLHNCSMHLKQCKFSIDDKEYVAVVVPHEAEHFQLKTHKQTLEYTIMDAASIMCDQDLFLYQLKKDGAYCIMGTYKGVEETQQYYRNALVNKGLNIDENILIIQKIG